MLMAGAALLAGATAAPVMAQSPSVPAAAPSAAVSAGPAITVVAHEYRFEGLPTSVPAGATITLDNQGSEVHEIVIVRRNDGATQTWDELLAMPQEQAFQYITPVGQLMAGPGTTADGSIVLAQEGAYFALCFVPQGTTSMPDASAAAQPSAGTGTPHFMLGMRQEFTVTAAGTEVGPLPSSAPAGSMAPGSSAAPMPSAAASSAP